MKINGFGPRSVSGGSGPVRASGDDPDSRAEEIRVGAVDRADISNEGISLAQQAREVEEAAKAGIDDAQFELIQTRIESGFYKQPEVIDEVARRMVAAGDL